MGRIHYGGISREACLEFIADPGIGDYVMVHVGFAISKVNSARTSMSRNLASSLRWNGRPAQRNGELR
jgi:hydrogenase expression/formation protein HypC